MFNVRSVVYVRPLLTIHSQTELTINTHVTVVGVRDSVANMHATVSGVQHDTTNTYTMVSDMHRNMLKSQEGASDQHLSVSGTRTLSSAEYVLTTTQTQTRSVTSATSGSNVLHLHLAYPANHLPRRRGPVSDVKSWSRRSLAWQKT